MNDDFVCVPKEEFDMVLLKSNIELIQKVNRLIELLENPVPGKNSKSSEEGGKIKNWKKEFDHGGLFYYARCRSLRSPLYHCRHRLSSSFLAVRGLDTAALVCYHCHRTSLSRKIYHKSILALAVAFIRNRY